MNTFENISGKLMICDPSFEFLPTGQVYPEDYMMIEAKIGSYHCITKKDSEGELRSLFVTHHSHLNTELQWEELNDMVYVCDKVRIFDFKHEDMGGSMRCIWGESMCRISVAKAADGSIVAIHIEFPDVEAEGND